jgi:SAM-dependent methyltransferase
MNNPNASKSSGSILAIPNPIFLKGFSREGEITLVWDSEDPNQVEIHLYRPDGPLISRAGLSGRIRTWASDGMVFYLQDVSDGRPLTLANTIDTTTIKVVREDLAMPLESVDLGSLRNLAPISRQWGFDRGLPVDRYYIENFLSNHAKDIQGQVLEMGSNRYTIMFGRQQVEKSDVLNYPEGDEKTTIVADLSNAPHVPSNSFDCIICTQTLMFIFEIKNAIHTLYRILKPGGILLATVSGITHTYDDEYDEEGWENYWFWNFTPLSVHRLFLNVFPEENLEVKAYGNVLAAVSFIHGLSAEELSRHELDYKDPSYAIAITLRAIKPNDMFCLKAKKFFHDMIRITSKRKLN